MLWFKFILGLMFFELISILFAIVPDYGNEYMTKENKNWTSFKNFAPKLNLHLLVFILNFHAKRKSANQVEINWKSVCVQSVTEVEVQLKNTSPAWLPKKDTMDCSDTNYH